jgi:hypothetical protein
MPSAKLKSSSSPELRHKRMDWTILLPSPPPSPPASPRFSFASTTLWSQSETISVYTITYPICCINDNVSRLGLRVWRRNCVFRDRGPLGLRLRLRLRYLFSYRWLSLGLSWGLGCGLGLGLGLRNLGFWRCDFRVWWRWFVDWSNCPIVPAWCSVLAVVRGGGVVWKCGLLLLVVAGRGGLV